MSGDGVDRGAVYQAILGEAADLRTVAADVRAQRTQLGDLDGKVDGLRQAMTAYHATVPGLSILISELDERLRRVEQHLGLPPAACCSAARDEVCR